MAEKEIISFDYVIDCINALFYHLFNIFKPHYVLLMIIEKLVWET